MREIPHDVQNDKCGDFCHGLLGLVSHFRSYWISKFDLKHAKKLVEALSSGTSLPKEAGGEIMRQLQDLHGIDLNPLLVTVFVATSNIQRRDIPANITELFKKFTELLLGRWDIQKGLNQQYQSQVKDFLLRAVALKMHRERRSKIPLQDFREIIRTQLEERGLKADIEVCIDEILNRSGLLRREGDQLLFRHMMFQEFFAGRAVETVEDFRTLVSDEWWRNAIVFYFGDRPDAHYDITKLVNSIEETSSDKLYNAAITIGLALQACYLTKTRDRTNILDWVIRSLAATYESFVEYVGGPDVKFPLYRFLEYYIGARDSVASRNIQDLLDGAVANAGGTLFDENVQLRMFWCIVGLIESGNIAKAEEVLGDFHPDDNRLLLAIFLGCFLIQNLRISTSDEKKAASRIIRLLETRVHALRQEIMQEFNSLLLEMRQGAIKALPGPDKSRS